MLGITDNRVHYLSKKHRRPAASSVPRSKDQALIQKVTDVVKEIGLTSLTTQKVVNRLAAQLPPTQVSVSMARKILRDELGLRFKQFKLDNDRQTDTQFNPKRLWISRLLSHLLISDVLVVAVDESNFNHI